MWVSIVTSLGLISAVADYNTYLLTALYIASTYIISVKSQNFSCSTACFKTQAGAGTAVLIFPMSSTNVRIDWKLIIVGPRKQSLSFVKWDIREVRLTDTLTLCSKAKGNNCKLFTDSIFHKWEFAQFTQTLFAYYFAPARGPDLNSLICADGASGLSFHEHTAKM